MTNSASPRVSKSEHGIIVLGTLSFKSVADILHEAKPYFKQNTNKDVFVIDCKLMKRIDSAGIALLLEWKRQCIKDNKVCHFEGLPKQAQALLHAYGLETLIAA